MDPVGDSDVHRVWTLLTEVSEQLSQNRSSAVNLNAIADGAKSQAIHSQTGFVIRRFNLDRPKEVYDAELERMNAAMSAENQTLLNDNRQLSALIREYELTLENVMETFRTRAHEVQQRELALMRQYERLIIERETEITQSTVTLNNARSESLARAGRMLRALMRRLGGEDIGMYGAYAAHTQAISHGESRELSSSTDAPSPVPVPRQGSSEAAPAEAEVAAEDGEKERDKGKARDDAPQTADTDTEEEEEEVTQDEESQGAQGEVVLPERDLEVDRMLDEEDDTEKRLAAAEWSLERECELARLERENEELRALVNGLLKPVPSEVSAAHGAPHSTTDSTSSSAPIPIPIPDCPDGENEDRTSDQQPSYATLPRRRQLGGPPGSVGPFGTYKKATVIRVDSR